MDEFTSGVEMELQESAQAADVQALAEATEQEVQLEPAGNEQPQQEAAQKESGTAEIVREENGVVTYEEIKYISGDIYTKEIEKFKQSVLEKTNLP